MISHQSKLQHIINTNFHTHLSTPPLHCTADGAVAIGIEAAARIFTSFFSATSFPLFLIPAFPPSLRSILTVVPFLPPSTPTSFLTPSNLPSSSHSHLSLPSICDYFGLSVPHPSPGVSSQLILLIGCEPSLFANSPSFFPSILASLGLFSLPDFLNYKLYFILILAYSTLASKKKHLCKTSICFTSNHKISKSIVQLGGECLVFVLMLNHQYAHFFYSKQRLEMSLHELLDVQTLTYQEVSFPNPFCHFYFYDKRRVMLKSNLFFMKERHISFQ